jgi:TRL (tRNA-associated locus)-like protein
MKNITAGLIALALASLVSGCAAGQGGAMGDEGLWPTGFIYTHTRHPLTVDMHQTRVVDTEKSGDIKHIALYTSIAAWDSAAIGDIAKKNGLTEIYFADVETFSILSVWNRYTVHVYGK